jgi:hypothetical protein
LSWVALFSTSSPITFDHVDRLQSLDWRWLNQRNGEIEGQTFGARKAAEFLLLVVIAGGSQGTC